MSHEGREYRLMQAKKIAAVLIDRAKERGKNFIETYSLVQALCNNLNVAKPTAEEYVRWLGAQKEFEATAYGLRLKQ
jgi:hypothetical protein